MTTTWMGIAPDLDSTRVIAMSSPRKTILRACLSKEPMHRRAIPTLLEAIALWQGLPVHAVLCADESVSLYDSNLYREAVLGEGGALYDIALVPPDGRPLCERREEYGGFYDLEQLVSEEATR